MLEIYNGRQHFYQWDINQKVLVDDEIVREIHYDNGTGQALVCAVYDYEGRKVADVPNILLQSYWSVRVYAVCGECVRYEKTYEVKSRKKPIDYVYTETEVKRYEDLEKRIYNLEQGGSGDIDLTNYYTKAETNSLLEGLEVDVDLSNYYTKEETNEAISTNTYDLPTASDTVKGGVKVGSGLQMDGDVLEVKEEELELIETITFDGTVGNVARTGLSLKVAELYIHTQAAQATTSVGVEARNAAGMFGYAWLGNMLNTGERYAFVRLVSQGKGEAYCEYSSPAATDYSSGAVAKTAGKMDGSTYISRISMYVSGGSPFPEGSIIEIWGVRA